MDQRPEELKVDPSKCGITCVCSCRRVATYAVDSGLYGQACWWDLPLAQLSRSIGYVTCVSVAAPALQVSYSEQQVSELQQQLEKAIAERSQAAAELAAAAAASADAQGQLAALRQQATGREQQVKDVSDKVGDIKGGLNRGQAKVVAAQFLLSGVHMCPAHMCTYVLHESFTHHLVLADTL